MNNLIKKKHTPLLAGLLLTAMATNANAQVWPQSEDAYMSSQQSPQWIENKGPAMAPQARQAMPANPQYLGQPNQYYNRPMNAYPSYPSPYAYGPPGYPYAYGYVPPRRWNRNTNKMPFFGNKGGNPWDSSNWPMPNMGNMPNFDMPSPSFTFPTMDMPSWN